MPIGWVGVSTQLGVTMAGSFSTSARTSSNERLPEPMTMAARNSSVWIPDASRIRPTSWRLARWRDSRSPPPRPPR